MRITVWNMSRKVNHVSKEPLLGIGQTLPF